VTSPRKKILLWCISLFAFLTCVSSFVSAQSKWQSLISTECGFTVAFPGKPHSEFRSLKVDSDVIDYRSYEYDSNKNYVLGVTCNAITAEGSQNPDALIDSARDAAIETLHATKGREMRLKVQGHMARLVELSGDGFTGYGELVVANGKYYQVLAIVQSRSYSIPAKKFVKSFKFLESPTAN
jgi:hypothetical protein